MPTDYLFSIFFIKYGKGEKIRLEHLIPPLEEDGFNSRDRLLIVFCDINATLDDPNYEYAQNLAYIKSVFDAAKKFYGTVIFKPSEIHDREKCADIKRLCNITEGILFETRGLDFKDIAQVSTLANYTNYSRVETNPEYIGMYNISSQIKNILEWINTEQNKFLYVFISDEEMYRKHFTLNELREYFELEQYIKTKCEIYLKIDANEAEILPFLNRSRLCVRRRTVWFNAF